MWQPARGVAIHLRTKDRQHLISRGIERQAGVDQDLCGDPFFLAQEPEQQMLGADVGMIEVARLGHRSSNTFFARDVYGRSGPVTVAELPRFTVSSTRADKAYISMPTFWRTVAAPPSPSRRTPSSTCSVPMYSGWSRAASSRDSESTFRTRSVKL